MSGVIFTREPNYNFPYYIINYDTSGKTNIITSGKNNNSIQTICIFRNKIDLSIKFRGLLKNIKSLEKIMGTDRIDIEFAKKKIINGYCFNVDHFWDIMLEKILIFK